MATSGTLTSNTITTDKGTHWYTFNWSVDNNGVCSWSFVRSGQDTQWYYNNQGWTLNVGGDVRTISGTVYKNDESQYGSFNVSGNVSINFSFVTRQQVGTYTWTINETFTPTRPAIGGKPPTPDAPSVTSPILYGSSLHVSLPRGATAMDVSWKTRTASADEWGVTSFDEDRVIFATYRFSAYCYDESYENPQSDYAVSIVKVKLNVPSISLTPQDLNASTIEVGPSFLSNDATKFTVSADKGTNNDDGAVTQVAYAFPGYISWDDYSGSSYTNETVTSVDDFALASFYARTVTPSDEFLSSDVVELPKGSLHLSYAPKEMRPSGFTWSFSYQGRPVTTDTVVVPDTDITCSWGSFPLNLVKGNFSYYKLVLVSEPGSATEITTGYLRNNQDSGSSDSLRVSSSVFKNYAGKRYKLRLIPSYYYYPPANYPNGSEGFYDCLDLSSSPNEFDSPTFLVGGFPDTPTMLYPSTSTAHTFNDAPQIIFKVTDSLTSVKDIRIVVGSVTYRYSTNKDLFESKSWTSGKPDTITSGTVIAFKLPSSTATSRATKIYTTNSYGLECLSPAEFTFNYHDVSYRVKDQKITKAIDENYFNNILDSYSLVSKVSASLYQNSEIVLSQGFVDALTAMKTLRSEIIKLIPDQSEDTVSKINSYLESAKVSKDETLKGQSTAIVKGNNFNYVLDVLKTML